MKIKIIISIFIVTAFISGYYSLHSASAEDALIAQLKCPDGKK